MQNNKASITVPRVKRIVKGRSFLKSIQWAFFFDASLSFEENTVFSFLQQLGYTKDPTGSTSFYEKDGIVVSITREVLLLSVDISNYQSYEVFRDKMVDALKLLPIIQIQQIKTITCHKVNRFLIDKLKLGETIDREQIMATLFSKQMCESVNGKLLSIQDEKEMLFGVRSSSETVDKIVFELKILGVFIEDINLNELVPALNRMNDRMYDMWHFVLSEQLLNSLQDD